MGGVRTQVWQSRCPYIGVAQHNVSQLQEGRKLPVQHSPAWVVESQRGEEGVHMKGMVWQGDSTMGRMASHAGRVRRRYKRAVRVADLSRTRRTKGRRQ